MDSREGRVSGGKRGATAGYVLRAAAIIAGDASTPDASYPAWHSALRSRPEPQPTSTTRAPGRKAAGKNRLAVLGTES